MNRSTKIFTGLAAAAVIAGGIYAATSHNSSSSNANKVLLWIGLRCWWC